MKKYQNQKLKPEERAADLLQELSLDEKMAQVRCYFAQGFDHTKLESDYPYGVGQISSLEMRGLETIEDCVRFQHELQERAMRQSPHRIPAIFHMEGLAGAYIQGAVSFPVGINRASSWDVELEEEIGKIVARQERALGITQTFAPVLDISRDSRMGRQGETYGEDPVLAAAMGSALTRGIQEEETEGLRSHAVAKHFTGFHNSEAGIHGTNCQIDARLLREVYAKPFQAAISNSGLMGIMPSYNTIQGEPVSVSKMFLTDLLRQEMGFKGTTVSDYGAIGNVHRFQKVCESFAEAGLRSMEAGMDMELHVVEGFNDELRDWFGSGKADIAILDRAVLRILTVKFEMGLFERPFALEGEKLDISFNQESDRKISKQSAAESIILLKNKEVLPIRNDVKKIAVIGCHAGTPRILFGGYTHFSMTEGLYAAKASMAGVKEKDESVEMRTYPGSQVQIDDIVPDSLIQRIAPSAKSLFEQLKLEFPQVEFTYSYGYPYIGDDLSGHAAALEEAKKSDLIILTLGGKHGTSSIATMGEGVDGSDINLPFCQDEFIRLASELGKPMVGIHFNGRPVSSNMADLHLDALLEAWNPSEAGAEVLCEILSGAYNPCGKLPVSVAYHAGQIPVYYNHPNGSGWHQGDSIGFPNYVDLEHKPRYPFGFGLSYTNFEYHNLTIEKSSISPRDSVRISFKITNTGKCRGTEIAQLYLSDRYASMVRPNMELQGFARVSLEPGQTKLVLFDVKADQMAFLDREMNWIVEAGDIDVMIGSSSRDIHLSGEFYINESCKIEGKARAFYALGKVVE